MERTKLQSCASFEILKTIKLIIESCFGSVRQHFSIWNATERKYFKHWEAKFSDWKELTGWYFSHWKSPEICTEWLHFSSILVTFQGPDWTFFLRCGIGYDTGKSGTNANFVAVSYHRRWTGCFRDGNLTRVQDRYALISLIREAKSNVSSSSGNKQC